MLGYHDSFNAIYETKSCVKNKIVDLIEMTYIALWLSFKTKVFCVDFDHIRDIQQIKWALPVILKFFISPPFPFYLLYISYIICISNHWFDYFTKPLLNIDEEIISRSSMISIERSNENSYLYSTKDSSSYYIIITDLHTSFFKFMCGIVKKKV